MNEKSRDAVTFHILFALKEDSSLEEFCPAVDAYFGHLKEKGFAKSWEIDRR